MSKQPEPYKSGSSSPPEQTREEFELAVIAERLGITVDEGAQFILKMGERVDEAADKFGISPEQAVENIFENVTYLVETYPDHEPEVVLDALAFIKSLEEPQS